MHEEQNQQENKNRVSYDRKPGYEFWSKSKKQSKASPKDKKYILTGTGRRKTAVAGTFLYQEKGEIIVNGVNIDTYFPSEKERAYWKRPFHTIGVSHPQSQFSATIKVSGSGKAAQLDAVVHSLSRALAQIDEEWHIALRKNDFLTRDDRMVERKKPFLKKARKRPQFSKR